MESKTYTYRIHPDIDQEAKMLAWLEQCRRVYNYALRQRKDWINSRKCRIDACSLRHEYIMSADEPYPDYYKQQNALTEAKKQIPELKAVHSQVLQDALKRLDQTFKMRKERGFGFPRFKKFGRYRSFVFPQFKSSPITDWQIKLPKVGKMPIVLHRAIPESFVVKQVRVLLRASGWYAQLILQSEESIPEVAPHGEPLGIDWGISSFVATSSGELIDNPRFYLQSQSKLKWLQRKKVDAKGSSQLCPECGANVPKDLGVRIHNCPECHVVMPRDVASGKIIVNRGIAAVEGLAVKLGAEEES